jgi:flavin-dependent dehydrogenase
MGAPASIEVIGGGPAGCAAALAALAQGSQVTLFEKSRFPRHKVCGEFLSPEVEPLLAALELGPAFQAAGPVRIVRVEMHVGRRTKHIRLPQPAFSLSRAALDRLLLDEALRRGAELRTERRKPDPRAGRALIVAHGRQAAQKTGERLFGFKAHFADPCPPTGEGAVELYFSDRGYVGVSPVEGGAINVCGLAPEEELRAHGFRPEQLLPARLRGLEPRFDWLLTGPLVYRGSFRSRAGVYLAGDALGFVDPFTGSGILAALLTGRLAGEAASRGLAFEDYYAQCRRMLRRQYRVASALRGLLGSGLTANLARWIPGSLLYRLTRPRV